MLEGLRILVAEDDWLLAEMLVGTLQAAGCVVVGPAAGLQTSAPRRGGTRYRKSCRI